MELNMVLKNIDFNFFENFYNYQKKIQNHTRGSILIFLEK